MSFLLNIIMSNMFFFGFYIFYILHNYIRGNIRTESHNLKKKMSLPNFGGKNSFPPQFLHLRQILSVITTQILYK